MLYQLSYKPILKLKMAVRTGLEPATSCVTGRHSNQLNYQTMILVFLIVDFEKFKVNCGSRI